MSEQKKKLMRPRATDKQAKWPAVVLTVIVALSTQTEQIRGFIEQMGASPETVGFIVGALGLAGLVALAITKEKD